MDQARLGRRRSAQPDRRREQWLADLIEDLQVHRAPTRLTLLHAVEEAARRAESRARLELALLALR